HAIIMSVARVTGAAGIFMACDIVLHRPLKREHDPRAAAFGGHAPRPLEPASPRRIADPVTGIDPKNHERSRAAAPGSPAVMRVAAEVEAARARARLPVAREGSRSPARARRARPRLA